MSWICLPRLIWSRSLVKGCITPLRTYAKVSSLSSDVEAIDFANRKQSLLESNLDVYPIIGKVTPKEAKIMRIPEFIHRWSDMELGEPNTDIVTVRGRILSIRKSGKNLLFIDLIQDFQKLQVVVNCKKFRNGLYSDEFLEHHKIIRRGDHVSAVGYAWRTKSGELSVLADRNVELLSPCLHPLPLKLTNSTTRIHNRMVDLAVNKESKEMIRARSTIIRTIRRFFENRGFTEVQTPILSSSAGGANAKPFITKSNALSSDGKEVELSMRIAPELWLKRLVISGFDKLYEIGPVFRNEGIDATHNPEFTSCEFYQSYTSLEELMELTESLLRETVQQTYKKHPIFHERLSKIQLEMSAKFQRIDFIEQIEKETGLTLPQNLVSVEELSEYYKCLGLSIVGDTPAKLLDHLASIYIEPHCTLPTFIYNHPRIMAPLAKSEDRRYNGVTRQVSRRFELFVRGRELVNAYEEENSPYVQKENFISQLKFKDEGDVDDEYVKALEWGLPPTGGWGMGIDRLCMYLTGADRIGQMLTFGGVKTLNYQ